MTTFHFTFSCTKLLRAQFSLEEREEITRRIADLFVEYGFGEAVRRGGGEDGEPPVWHIAELFPEYYVDHYDQEFQVEYWVPARDIPDIFERITRMHNEKQNFIENVYNEFRIIMLVKCEILNFL